VSTIRENRIEREHTYRAGEPVRIQYGPEEHQFGDLRLPEVVGEARATRVPEDSNTIWPVCIVIHGGFWYAQYGLDLMDKMSTDLAERGYATWNVEYRRVGQAGGGWPGTLKDVAAAADFFREMAATQPIDVNRVGAVGHSAGGHLALWLAARHKLPETSLLYSENPLRLVGVVSQAGVADLEAMWEVRQEESPVVDLLGGTPAEVSSRYTEASPAALLPTGVRQVLVHGTADNRVPISISEGYYNLAMEMGDEITLVELPGVDHFALINPDSDAWDSVIQAIEDVMR